MGLGPPPVAGLGALPGLGVLGPGRRRELGVIVAISNVAALVFFPETYLGYVSGRPSDLCVLVSRRWPELRVAVSSGHRPTLGLGGDDGVVVVVGLAAQW